MSNIVHWLSELGLEKYVSVFTEAEVDFETLPDLVEEDLKELGLPLGPRRKIWGAIKRLGDATVSTDKVSVENTSLSTISQEPATSHDAERRHLTVMFVDLVGSTEMASKIDPEDMRNVITNYQNTIAGIVTRFEGFVAKFMGDGVLCYFGWPRANEDDAERAVRAGLEMIASVMKVEGPNGAFLSTRVGIATGVVIVGDLIGSGATQEAAVVGETPNLAARLQGLAEPNQLVLPQETRSLLGDIFELEPLGKHNLKGILEPVPAFAVIGENTRESRFAARQTGVLTPIVGREQELSLMNECWVKAKSGKGQMIVVSGEAGIGKSRITQAMIDKIAKDEHTHITCQCSPYHTDSAFHPIIQQMLQAARFEPQDNTDIRLDKLESLNGIDDDNVGLLTALLGIDGSKRYGQLEMTPPQQRTRTMQALIQMIKTQANSRPLLLVFEDLHWIDPTSLELLDITLDAIAGAKVLILATARPAFEHGFGGHPIVTRFALNRLGRDQIVSIVDKLTAGKSLPEEVMQAIAARTDGVPLFVEELTKTILESNILREDGSRYVLDGPLESLAIPSSLHDSLMARLDRLQPVKEVAQTAACIGREFGHQLLAMISPLNAKDLDKALAGLIKAELVFRRGLPPDATYLFKHALVRDAAYESLLKERRKAIHGNILKALKEEASATSELLAHHAQAAGLNEQAIDLWESAGKIAMQRPAYEEAISHFDHAIKLIEPKVERGDLAAIERSLDVHVQLGQPLIAGHGFAAKKTKQVFEKALALAENLEDTPLYTEMFYGHWVTKYVHADHLDALELAKTLKKLGDKSGDRTQCLIASRILGVSLTFDGQHEQAQIQLDHALSIYDPIKDNSLANRFGQEPAIALKVYCAMNLWFLGETCLAAKHAKEVEEKAISLGHVQSTCYTYAHLMIYNVLVGNTAEFERHCNEVASLAQEHSMQFWKLYESVFRGLLLMMQGKREGVEVFEKSLLAYEASGSHLYIASLTIHIGWSALKMDMMDTANNMANTAESRIVKTGEMPELPELLRLKAAISLKESDDQGAEVFLKKALEVAEKNGSKSISLRAAIDLARLWGDAGRVTDAIALLKPAYESIAEGNCMDDCATARELLLTMQG